MPLGEEHKKKRSRNYALAGVLLAIVVIFFVVTIVKLKGISG
jgi:hypothetical protein